MRRSASPFRLRPLELGCDISLHSATKVLAGHDDLLAGIVTVSDDALYDRLHQHAPSDGSRRVGRHGLARRAGATDARSADRADGGVRAALFSRSARRARGGDHARYPGFGFVISFDVADGAAARRVETATGRSGTRRASAVSTRSSSRGTAGRASAARRGCCDCRSASRTPRCSGPTSSRRSRAPDELTTHRL